MVLDLLGMHGFMQPLRTQGKEGCGAEYLWGRSSARDPISLRQFYPYPTVAPHPCVAEVICPWEHCRG